MAHPIEGAEGKGNFIVPHNEGFNLTIDRGVDPRVKRVTEGVLLYRDLLRDAQPRQDPNAPRGTRLLSPGMPDSRTLFRQARGLSAWLRTQNEHLSPSDAEFVRRSIPLFADEEKPFRTDTPLRDERVAGIDHRYGNGQLLEALTEVHGLRELMRIGTGINKGRKDMRDQATPVATILGLIAEKTSADRVVQAAEKIVQASEDRLAGSTRLENRKGEKERAAATAELTEAVKFLADMPLVGATQLVLSVLHYSVDENLPQLRKDCVDALRRSMRHTIKQIGEDKNMVDEYRFSLNTLRVNIPNEADHEQGILATLVRDLSVY